MPLSEMAGERPGTMKSRPCSTAFDIAISPGNTAAADFSYPAGGACNIGKEVLSITNGRHAARKCRLKRTTVELKSSSR
jgi:hypothetical protein